ncbi:MAG: hypothetical protein [Siphoviridae sp. ctCJE6]|nr:MAG: hypothetical protein [Siphoviridae sp. ctCJE6]
MISDGEEFVLEDVYLVTSTNLAYLVETFDDQQFWIPKSQVINIEFGLDFEDEDTGRRLKEIKSMTIPLWLAEDKGM